MKFIIHTERYAFDSNENIDHNNANDDDQWKNEREIVSH